MARYIDHGQGTLEQRRAQRLARARERFNVTLRARLRADVGINEAFVSAWRAAAPHMASVARYDRQIERGGEEAAVRAFCAGEPSPLKLTGRG